MQSYECVIISKMFLIYFISYGCNDSALVFLGGAEASASPSFALPMFITIKKIIILHLFLGVPAATVGGTGTPWHTRGYAPAAHLSSLYIMQPIRISPAGLVIHIDDWGKAVGGVAQVDVTVVQCSFWTSFVWLISGMEGWLVMPCLV